MRDAGPWARAHSMDAYDATREREHRPRSPRRRGARAGAGLQTWQTAESRDAALKSEVKQDQEYNIYYTQQRGPDTLLTNAGDVVHQADITLQEAEAPPPTVSTHDPSSAVASVVDPGEKQRAAAEQAQGDYVKRLCQFYVRRQRSFTAYRLPPGMVHVIDVRTGRVSRPKCLEFYLETPEPLTQRGELGAPPAPPVAPGEPAGTYGSPHRGLGDFSAHQGRCAVPGRVHDAARAS